MDTLISVDEIIKFYGRFRALDKLSFNIPKGISVLIGPNGAGKTTTIKILAGILNADYGIVSVLGHDPWREKEKLIGKVAFLLEYVPLKLSVKVKDYMELFSRKFGVPYNDIIRVIDNMGLKPHLYKSVSTLSAGLKKRLLISQCLLINPEIIIMDEPFSNLDAVSINNILNIIKELGRKEGISFLISSHFIPLLEDLSDYVVIINGGRKIIEGKYQSLVRKFVMSHKHRKIKIVSPHIAKIIELIRKYKEVDILEIIGETAIVNISPYQFQLFSAILRDILETGIEIDAIEIIKPTLKEIYFKMMSPIDINKIN